MSPESPTVSVIVCVHLWERIDQLTACVDSLRRQRLKPLEIIVVVDGEPGLRTELAARSIGDVVLATPRPSGLSAARNVGISHAQGSFLAFLDDDAVADEHWLGALLDVLEDPAVAGAGGVSEPLWTGSPPRWFPMELLWAVGCSYAGLPTSRSDVRNVFGGCAVLRRELFEELGGFAPELGRASSGLAGCEETEFCMRVLEAHPHMTFVHEPVAVIYHRVPAGRQRVKYVLRRCLGEGRSKAIVRRRTALPVRPLGPEWNYVLYTVPGALRRYTAEAFKGDVFGLARAAVLALSVFCTVWEFLATSVRLVLTRGRAESGNAAPPPQLPHSDSGAHGLVSPARSDGDGLAVVGDPVTTGPPRGSDQSPR